MTLMLACVLCDQDRPLNGDGLCRNSPNPDDPKPRFNACEDLITHLASRLNKVGEARLRTKQRSEGDAKRILTYAASNMSIRFETGETWVKAIVDGEAPKLERQPDAPRKVVDGFVIDNLDIGKMHMDLIEAKRKASLYREMAQVEDGWQDAAVEAQAAVKQLTELIAAWEDDHGVK